MYTKTCAPVFTELSVTVQTGNNPNVHQQVEDKQVAVSLSNETLFNDKKGTPY